KRGGSAEPGTRTGLRYVSRNQPPSGCAASDSVRIQCSASASIVLARPQSLAAVPLRQSGGAAPRSLVLVDLDLVVVVVVVVLVLVELVFFVVLVLFLFPL